MPQYRICPHCRAHLDPGDQCDCDEQECIDQPRRQMAYKPTVYPREWNSQKYIQQKWLEFDMR